MTRKAKSGYMFLSDRYVGLARQRKEMSKRIGAEMRGSFTLSTELEAIAKELKHNPFLRYEDKELLEARKAELDAECMAKGKCMAQQDPLVEIRIRRAIGTMIKMHGQMRKRGA